MREDVEEARVLAAHGGVRDAEVVAELVGALVDERGVFELLVGAALDGVEEHELRGKERSALRDERVLVLQPFAERGGVVVDERVAVDGLVPNVMCAEECGEFFEKRRVFAPPCDAWKRERCEVVRIEEREHFVVGAILRDVVPRGFVHLRELADDVELERLGRARDGVLHGGIHGEVRELFPLGCGGGEVEVILKRLRGVRRELHALRVGGLAAAHGQCALRDLQEHLGLRW